MHGHPARATNTTGARGYSPQPCFSLHPPGELVPPSKSPRGQHWRLPPHSSAPLRHTPRHTTWHPCFGAKMPGSMAGWPHSIRARNPTCTNCVVQNPGQWLPTHHLNSWPILCQLILSCVGFNPGVWATRMWVERADEVVGVEFKAGGGCCCFIQREDVGCRTADLGAMLSGSDT